MSSRLCSAILGLLLAFALPAAGQDQEPSTASRLRVHLDCTDCFQDYLRDEIRWVDFVRQPQDADVQMLSTSQNTGGGGTETVLRFIGLQRFVGIESILRTVSLSGDSEDARRRAVLRTAVVGLLGFLGREGLPANLEVAVESPPTDADRQLVRDPWNSWVFGLGADASFQSEESNRETNWEFEVTVDRVTNNWKISTGLTFEQTNEKFDLDEDEPFEVRRRERQFNWFLAKSLGPHWSVGVDGDTESSTFSNVKFLAGAAPAVEFSVFPYEQYATRQLLLEYGVGVEHARYNEVSLFGVLRETRPKQEFSVTLDQRQRWGTLSAEVQWSQYLHDLSKSRLEFDGEMSIRIARGLSFEVSGNASRIRDQLSLPGRGATPEEVLLRIRQLQSGHEVNLSFGLNYSFGSIFNNVVNPRFGR